MTKAVNDKYFTKPSTVDLCLEKINFSEYDLIFEPSAGCGSFLHKLPEQKRSGVDISPDIPNVVKLDFYNIQKVIDVLDLKANPHKRYLSIGNPPFGYMAQMAIDFFNGCASFSDSVAFIVPRTFRKISVTNRLSLNFDLREEMLLPKNSFMIMDPSSPTLMSEYDVPCTFQIWDKLDILREKIPSRTTSELISFTSKISEAKYAFRRVGTAAGQLYDTTNKQRSMSPASHFYINCEEAVAKEIRSLEWDYNSPKYDTAGNPSISKNELILALEKSIEKDLTR
tara:strand:+ start:459 stop:1307 length:849 start_codon:yes stop_codon:yes gene_type:complete